MTHSDCLENYNHNGGKKINTPKIAINDNIVNINSLDITFLYESCMDIEKDVELLDRDPNNNTINSKNLIDTVYKMQHDTIATNIIASEIIRLIFKAIRISDKNANYDIFNDRMKIITDYIGTIIHYRDKTTNSYKISMFYHIVFLLDILNIDKNWNSAKRLMAFINYFIYRFTGTSLNG